MYVPEVEKTKRHAYKSKYDLTRENQVILLMISDGEKWHYLTVRSLSALLRGITPKHKGDSYCLNCFHSYPSKESLEKHMKVCEDKGYCYIGMPKKGETLEYHPGVKSMKTPYIIVADIDFYLEKWMLVLMIKVNHQQKRKISMKCVDIHCLLTVHLIKKKMDYYRSKGFLKKFCQDLKKQARSIIDFEKKELQVLTIDEEFKHHMATECYICEKKFYKDKKNNYIKVRDHRHYTGKYRGAVHKICNLMYNTPIEIPVVFYNGSSCISL